MSPVLPAREHPIVAIDGPAGAGKSTVARRLARELGFVLLDTGALYRTVALAAERAGIDWDDGPRLTALTATLTAAGRIELGCTPAAGDAPTSVRLDGEDVSATIRTPSLSLGASRVSAVAGVRTALLELQRSLGRRGAVVAEGRDVGTVVFPDAEVKLFVTASVEERARRRHRELRASGIPSSIEQVHAEVETRDRQDTERDVAPLRSADDARLVDTTGLSIDEVVSELKRVVETAS